MEKKTCQVCKKEYPATTEFFYRCSAVKSGLYSRCKECASTINKANHKKVYEKNKTAINAKNMERYYKKHPKVIREVFPDGMKRCSVCKEIKPKTDEFFGRSKQTKDGFKFLCKSCRSAEYQKDREHNVLRSKEYYENNKEKAAKANMAYRQKNLEWYQKNNKEYYQKNRERMIENSKRSLYRRIETDVGFKILQRLRKRMYEAVKGLNKSARTQELIGCSNDELKLHLEKQFIQGMSWENYGQWHVDHIVPCSSFDFTKSENQFACFNYRNLQPLWAIDNIRKSNRQVGEEKWNCSV